MILVIHQKWPGHFISLIVKSDVGLHSQKRLHEDKLQGKAVTHSCEVEWWRTLMVECVTVFIFPQFLPTSLKTCLKDPKL